MLLKRLKVYLMNRQRIYSIGAGWLMIVFFISCTPMTNETEPEAATPALTPTAALEEPNMNDEENETPATAVPLELSTPQPEKPISPDQPLLPDKDAVIAKPTIPVPNIPKVQEQVVMAKEDLAGRFNFDTAVIELVEYQTVTWRDGSLGCPQPGLAYTQALVDGYRLQLQMEGVQYNYHGSTNGDPFYCPSPNGIFDPGTTNPDS
jgi:hypothetical protein